MAITSQFQCILAWQQNQIDKGDQVELINHYSMIWSGIFVLVLAALFVFRKGFQLNKVLLLIGIAAVLLAGWFILRPQQATTTELVQFNAELGQGRSVLLELQSPY